MTLPLPSDSIASTSMGASSINVTPADANASVPAVTLPKVDRRAGGGGSSRNRRGSERRQFGSSHSGLSADGRDLAAAIDEYKLQHHRRYITCDEMLVVLRQLGYAKTA